MSYYGVGDYYRAGDPGLFSSIGSFLGKTAKAAVGYVTGGPTGAIQGFTGSGSSTLRLPTQQMLRITPGAAAPGGQKMLTIDPMTGAVRRKRRRMNYANSKALTRANRRVDGFVTLAKKSLKHTNYKIVSKSAGKARRSVSISERGSGSVSVG